MLLFAGAVVVAQPRRAVTNAPPLSPEIEAFLGHTPRVEACNIAGTIACGSTVVGTTNGCTDGEYYADFWIFNGVAGQPVTVRVTNASLIYDVGILIQDYGAGGAVLQSTVARGAATLTFTPARTKQYSATIGYVAKYYAKSYTLSFTCGTGGAVCQSAGTLQRGQWLSGALSQSGPCNNDYYWTRYDFDGKEGVPVHLTVNASFPLYMQANSVGAETQTTLDTERSLADFVFYPDVTGIQHLWVSNSGTGNIAGTFSVLLEDEPLDPCKRRAVRH